MKKYNIQNLSKNFDKYEKEYLNEILNIKSLSNEETLELIKRIKNNDLEASNKLIYHNLRLILLIVQSYAKEDIDIFDLLHDCSFKIVECAKKYNLDSNTKPNIWILIHIRYYILDLLVKYTQIVPINIYYINLKYKKVLKELEEKLQRKPSDKEIIEELKISNNYFRYCSTYFNLINNFIPLYDCINQEDLNNNLIENIDEELYKIELKNEFDKIYKKAKLNNIQIEVLKLYYGLDENDKLSLKQISSKLNFTKQYIQQVRSKAYEKIIKCDYIKELANYMQYPDKSLEELDELKIKLKKNKKHKS